MEDILNLLEKAHKASETLATKKQEDIDKIVKAIRDAVYEDITRLSELEVKETGFGTLQGKVIENIFATKHLYNYIRGLKTVGVININLKENMLEIAKPKGIIVSVVSRMSSVAKAVHDIMLAIKSANAIVILCTPSTLECVEKAVYIINKATVIEGLPAGAITFIKTKSKDIIREVINNKKISLILANGDEGILKDAFYSKTKAICCSYLNLPCFIDKSADIEFAVRQIASSKIFNNGATFTAEQAVIVLKESEEEVLHHFKMQGAYVLNRFEKERLKAFFQKDQTQSKIAGKKAVEILKMLNVKDVNDINTRLIIVKEDDIKDTVFSKQTLAPIVTIYTVDTLEHAILKCRQILSEEMLKYAVIVHTAERDMLERFAAEVPSYKIISNAPAIFEKTKNSKAVLSYLSLGAMLTGDALTFDNVTCDDMVDTKKVTKGYIEIDTLLKQSKILQVNQKDEKKKEEKQIAEKDQVTTTLEQMIKELKG